ncbi:hypothetical protein GALMADRAFT_543563 [Galerina marginata CBS 339.88]|uniref:DUF6533 domain-containing protein n=1 Tax=Galerina marginata (strain CBS 339.88) TaxID=685588 RepID=A0A067SWG4_GALM3|nr:hypothetical protein GALMADRAFT_543563 [Galerina marginata CBS 339.88]
MTGSAHGHDVDDQWAMFIVRYTCYSCITVLTWEWLTTLSFEVRTIWRKSTPYATKLLYFYPRYLGLVSSICNSIAISRIHEIYIVDRDTCQWWYGFQLLVSDTMVLALEMLLMFRIFALFERKPKMAMFLCGLLVSKTVVIILLGVYSIRRITFGDACLAKGVPVTVMYSSALEMLVQTVIWCLTLYKHFRTHLEHQRQTIPLLSIVTRDGSWSFLLVSVIYVALIKDAFTGTGRLSDKTARLCDITFPILTSTISFTSCRIIMNMQKFAQSQDSNETDSRGIYLTTVYSDYAQPTR